MVVLVAETASLLLMIPKVFPLPAKGCSFRFACTHYITPLTQKNAPFDSFCFSLLHLPTFDPDPLYITMTHQDRSVHRQKATKAQQSSHGSGDGFSVLERWSLLSRNRKFLFGGGAALLLIVIIVVAVVASGGGSSDGSILVDTNSSADTSVGDGSL